jgi:hypothetical protein
MASFSTVKVVTPTVNISEDQLKTHVVLVGGLRNNQVALTFDSWGSPGAPPASQLSINIFPPSTTTIVDRYIKLRFYIQVITTGVSTNPQPDDGKMELGLNDALRQFPMSSLFDVMTVQINGESISDNIGDHLHALAMYGISNDTLDKSSSVSPGYPDQFQEYGDWSLPPPVGGNGRSELAGYGVAEHQHRGAFPVVLAGDHKSFTAVVTEGIFMSPWLCGFGDQEEGMVNVNQLTLNIRLKSDYQRILSHAQASPAPGVGPYTSGGNYISSVVLNFTQAPEALVTFITPTLLQKIPSMQVLPYYKPLEFIKSLGAVAPGASIPVVGDSIKLSQIPRKLFLFCKIDRNAETFTTTDNLMSLEFLSILWGNQNGLFASSKSTELFETSIRNGLLRSWAQYSNFTGSCFCLEFGKDIGLLDGEAVGVQGQYQIQVSATFKNNSAQTHNYQFYTTFLLEGQINVSENQARASLGNLTASAVLAAKESPPDQSIDYKSYEALQGGNFFTSLKGFVNKLSRGVSEALPVVSPLIAAAFPAAVPALAAAQGVSGLVNNLTGDGKRRGRRLR